MRDYLIITIVLASLPMGVLSPFYGLLVYSWISYMNPHMLAWTFALTFPVGKISALSALTGAFLRGDWDLAPLKGRENILMMLLFGTFCISTAFALHPADAWSKLQDIAKIGLMSLLTAILVTDQKRVRYLVLVIALSLGFYGFKGGLFSVLTGGQYLVWGPDRSVIAGNNNLGLALNMSLPVFWYLAQNERGLLRRVLQATFFLSIPAIMFTYSRASALTLPIVLIAIIFKGGQRVLLLVVLLVAALIAVPLIPDIWWDRQETTINYEQDSSAMSRLDNWVFLWRLSLDRPLTGAGFEFSSYDTFAKYAPDFLAKYGKPWNTHNVFLGILAAHGFPAFFLFLAMIGFTLLSCTRMKYAVHGHPELKWISDYSTMIQLSFLGFAVNGMFVNMEYFDLVYQWVAIVCALKVICNRALSEVENAGQQFELSELYPVSATV
jgi:putative inorganic carbon (hco3(-)) transporter